MTRQDESAQADAGHSAPSTRRSRRDGEREAEHRALYADAPTASSMRVVDGSAPIYRTRREMRESASRLARDLPVIVEPTLETPQIAADEAVQPLAADQAPAVAPTPSVASAPAAEEPQPATGRRARRLSQQPAAEQPIAALDPALLAVEVDDRPVPRAAALSTPAASAPAASAPVDAAPAAAQPAPRVPAVASAPAEPIVVTRRGRRIAASATAPAADLVLNPVLRIESVQAAPSVPQPVVPMPKPAASWGDLVAASTSADREPAALEAESAPVVESVAPTAVVDEAPATTPTIALPVTITKAEPAAVEAAEAPSSEARTMTRAERRAAQAATSDEVSAAVAAVLGDEQADAASTPVRSPLQREARAPRPALKRRPVQVAPAVRPSRRARSRAARAVVQRLGAAGVILAIGSFVAVTSLPAQAFSPAPESSDSGYGDVQVAQELDVATTGPHGDEDVTAILSREDFGVDDAIASTRLDADELTELQAVADSEEVGPPYDGEPSLPAVWSQLETSYTQSPFPSLAEVPVSSGFGYRWGSFHGGVDLVPGAGTPVFPIANGVVVGVWQGNHPGGGGYQVIVEHNIDGEFFQSWYPHMQAGSIQVEIGQVVDISTQLGAVGSTGHSTGAHLHLEIKNADYVSVDPLVWLATREQILEP